jgi:transcriptional regulator with XRE-family HTH domain
MSREDPAPESLVFGVLRRSSGLTQRRFEEETGLKRGMASAYESGFRTPSREVLDLVGERRGIPRAEIDLLLWRYQIPPGSRHGPSPGQEPVPWGLTDLDLLRIRLEAADLGLLMARRHELDLIAGLSKRKLEAARAEAGRRSEELLALPTLSEQRRAVQIRPEYQSWLVVEKLCDASERAAAKDVKRALHLAELALLAAESFRGAEEERSRTRGYALIFVGNAQRVGSDLNAADRSFAQAERLWLEGAGAKWVLLEEWRLPDRLASLRRDQRRWDEVIPLQNAALKVAPRSSCGRILLSKAFALEQMGQYRRALRALKEAQPFVEAGGDPRLVFALYFNRSVNLIHIGALASAEQLFPEVRRMAIEQRQDLDLVRVTWLEGRIAAARGRLEEGISILQRVRREFTVREIAYDAALAGLEETILHLEAGDFARARQIAEGTVWVFQSRQVREEALKALGLLHEALRGEVATVELARRVRERFLRER